MRQIAEDTLTDLQQMRRTAAQTEPETEQELDFEAGDIFGEGLTHKQWLKFFDAIGMNSPAAMVAEQIADTLSYELG
ncbi:hypothetical protein R0J87_24120, partial [Halomonas sp. SIMBA_159]